MKMKTAFQKLSENKFKIVDGWIGCSFNQHFFFFSRVHNHCCHRVFVVTAAGAGSIIQHVDRCTCQSLKYFLRRFCKKENIVVVGVVVVVAIVVVAVGVVVVATESQICWTVWMFEYETTNPSQFCHDLFVIFRHLFAIFLLLGHFCNCLIRVSSRSRHR